ncbi:hypothetical protein ACLK2F_01915 [Escherichia coli]
MILPSDAGTHAGENPMVTIPLLGFMGVPSAIDITRVGSSGILPVIDTAIA